jgi:hypothetical protein
MTTRKGKLRLTYFCAWVGVENVYLIKCYGLVATEILLQNWKDDKLWNYKDQNQTSQASKSQATKLRGLKSKGTNFEVTRM